jgi:hypothetical protein
MKIAPPLLLCERDGATSFYLNHYESTLHCMSIDRFQRVHDVGMVWPPKTQGDEAVRWLATLCRGIV